ncbi:MAG: hypothetical protein JJE52_18005 [Acidimicrobiia bacterium]|nr:hypothetical protein [Acidimicrobiia bacterium]
MILGAAQRRTIEFVPGVDTGIGSLPHTDVDAAVAFVLERNTRLPAAPSLPQRSPLEGMVAQAAWGVPGVVVEPDGSLDLVLDELDPAAPVGDPHLEGEPFVAVRRFLDAVAEREGPIKLQLTGPVTLGLALNAAGADTEPAFAVASAAVRARAQALLDLAAATAPGCDLVVFLDEPGLTGLLHPEFPLDREAAIDLTSGALAVLEQRAITGLHCCGPTDWKLAIQAGSQIISTPLGQGIETVGATLGRFLDDGGWIAWGAVPTDEPIGSSPGRLWRQLSAAWCELVQGGCDPVLLRTHAMVTPACGLANHGVPQAEQVIGLTRQVAARLHEQAIGVRLAVGA